MARAAHGRADDLLTATLLTARCPVVFVPAMHTEMWEHPATQANVATLRDARRAGRRAGRRAAHRHRTPARAGCPSRSRSPRWRPPCSPAAPTGLAPDLAGRRLVVSAGGTREPLDPVRFLGNRSSGRMGYALAVAAAARGAKVTVVAANVSLPDPAGVDVVTGRHHRRAARGRARRRPRGPTPW